MNAMYTRIWKNPRNEKNRDKERLQGRRGGKGGRKAGVTCFCPTTCIIVIFPIDAAHL
jgi:hypothetical protein